MLLSLEPVQERIIYWSFPRYESDICRYSSLYRVPASLTSSHNEVAPNVSSSGENNNLESHQPSSPPSTNGSRSTGASRNFVNNTRDLKRQQCGTNSNISQHPFYRGIKLLEQGCVQNVLQVGELKFCTEAMD